MRVSRSIRGSDTVEGFVVTVGDEWLLLAVLAPTIHFDGYTALRLRDLAEVELLDAQEGFVGRALKARGEWPPVRVEVPLDDVADLIQGAASVAPLVTLHLEKDDPTVCHVGRPTRLTRRRVHLLDITPSAQWRDRPRRWALSTITRVDFGGQYEQALSLVGGEPPS